MIRTMKRLIAALALLTLLCSAANTDALTGYESLRAGSRGEAVTHLQARLHELGYLPDRVDGIYGRRTVQAVNTFQKNSGLALTGAASADLQQLLFDETTKPVTVYLAPSGIRYHSRPNCRGLKLAKSLGQMPFTEARLVRTPCIICYGRLALRVAEEEKEKARPHAEPARAETVETPAPSPH